MANAVLVLACLFAAFSLGDFAGILRKPFLQEPIEYKGQADPGSPLFLTPYVKKKDYRRARELSEVKGIDSSLRYHSYAGFFTVNETANSNMYFWFFPAKNGDTKAPLLLWLQGGPGGSSLFGLFNENGPILVDETGKIQPRPVNWNEQYSIVYIDNPVGTGFSFSSDEGYSTNEDQVADNLFECLQQFFLVFDDYQNNDFYITGESYAGKYIPALGYKIFTTTNATLKINLQGMAIGDGLCDPANIVDGYSVLMKQFGLVDDNQEVYVKKQTDAAIAEINAGNFIAAFNIFDVLLNGDTIPYPSYFTNITGSTDYFNILRSTAPEAFNYYGPLLETAEVRSQIHVGNLTYNDGSKVEHYLLADVMQPITTKLATLMDNYKVLLYNGQLDLIVGAPLTENYLWMLKWGGASGYQQAQRTVWKVKPTDIEVAGFVRQTGKFTQVIVRGAGHLVPYDQPERALDMLNKFIGYSTQWD